MFEQTATDSKDWERRKNAVSRWNRRRKWSYFLLKQPVDSDTKVLDVGFSDEEYQETDNFIEKNFPYPENLTALGIDSPKRFTERYPRIKVIQYPGGRFPFPDDSFDIVWSNAVVEHVGTRDDQLQFLREIRRVGGRIFVTTPNRYFPVEVHTRTPLLHFLPKPIFERYLHLIGKGWATGDFMRLLTLRELRSLLHEAGFQEYTIKRNRILGMTLDFVVTTR
jgi:SAM-dependent methyltransferase